jgi:predicted thioredoxin/glutaredoxin
MKIELFHAPGCSKCATAREDLKAAATAARPEVEWREINVLDEMDYAVERGVLSLPSVVIDGELVFSSLPSPQQMRAALLRRAASRS